MMLAAEKLNQGEIERPAKRSDERCGGETP